MILARLVGAIMAMIAAIAALVPAVALAHTRSETHSVWVIDGPAVRVIFTVPDREANRLSSDGQSPDDGRLIAYLAGHVGAETGGRSCAAAAGPHALAANTGFRRVDMAFRCAAAQGIVLHTTAFFDLVPSHTHIAEIEPAHGDFVEAVLTADNASIDLDKANGSTLRGAGLASFVGMGIMHIFTGVDHMSFLLGLVLISRRIKDLVFVITGFTLGHSATLALAVTGIVRPHAEFIDALVALTITLIGVENASVQSGRPGLLAAATAGALLVMAGLRLAGTGLLPIDLLAGAALFSGSYLMLAANLGEAGRLRLVVTLVFGLIHGFGFAADLLNEHIPTEKLVKLLLGFNLGVEIGQLTIVTLATATGAALMRWGIGLPRRAITPVAAAALIGIGTYWFVSRSFGVAA